MHEHEYEYEHKYESLYIIILVSGHEVLGNVYWEDIGEELLVVSLQVLHLLLLLCK